MEKFLYEEFYELEETHWWLTSKRRAFLAMIEKYIKPNTSDKSFRILDIGCGTGKNIEVLNGFGETWGLDNSADAIKFCKKRRLKNVRLGEAEKTHLPSNFFDLVTALDIIEHTVDDNITLKEIYRIIKPGGFLIVTVPALPWLWSQWDVVLHHYRRYTKKSLEKKLLKNHYRILKISYLFLFAILPMYILHLIKDRLYKRHYPPDFSFTPKPINWLAKLVSKIELFFALNFSLPLGISLFAVVQKK